jgi:hypothetical protein
VFVEKKDPNTNIDPDTNKDHVYEIPFPKAGKAPKIIAVGDKQGWMSERAGVPTEWFSK